jgi:quercetin dioxygenase-like cupin family protein
MRESGTASGERLRARLSEEGLEPSSWSNGPGDRYAGHSHDYDKVLVAATGSITFELPELAGLIELRTGDRLDLPAGTLHGAFVGGDGVTCLEAHLASGTLGPVPRHVPGWAESAPSGKTAGVARA